MKREKFYLVKKVFSLDTYVSIARQAQEALMSDKERRRLLFIAMNAALVMLFGVMTVVNARTSEPVLFFLTALFTIICLINGIVTYYTNKYDLPLNIIFIVETVALLTYFTISGNPDGFSVLWTSLIPSFAMLIFGMRRGLNFSILTFIMLIFLFRTDTGRELLHYDYGDTFMLRFPMLYVAMFVISTEFEYIRNETNNQLNIEREKYSHLYRHDALTGLFNRYGMQEYFDSSMKDSHRGEYVAIIMLDIDNFKKVNDTWGHDCGDVVLKAVSSVPGKVMCEHSHFCRWGGEEFLLMMQCEHDPIKTAEKVRAGVEALHIPYGDEIRRVTVSVGVGIAPSKIIDSDEQIHALIAVADEALYESKGTGKNKVTVMHMEQSA
jgi:diguanylate cyclase (GGDEF)-like protein